MARIAGVNIPTNKRVEIGLTYIYGIGHCKSKEICEKIGIPTEKRVNELSDDEVIKILNKTSKSLNEVISVNGDEESKLQLEIVKSLLPVSLTREDILLKVNELVASGITNVGGIMKEFAGMQVDRKIVSEVIKEVLV